jgi:hypothetical protein
MTEPARPRRRAVPQDDDRLMSVGDLAEFLGLPEATIYKQRSEGPGHPATGSESTSGGSVPRSRPGWRSTKTTGSEPVRLSLLAAFL